MLDNLLRQFDLDDGDTIAFIKNWEKIIFCFCKPPEIADKIYTLLKINRDLYHFFHTFNIILIGEFCVNLSYSTNFMIGNW